MKTHDVASRRLRSSRLSETPLGSPAEVVRWHVAMQAQDYGPAKWSVGQRLSDVVDSDVERALVTGEVLRTHVLRPTWHFVAGADIRWLLALTGPRIQKGNASRYRELDLDAPTLARCERAVAKELDGANHLTRKELAVLFEGAGIDTAGQRLPYILMHLELESVICSGAPRGKQQTYALLEERAPAATRFDREQAVVDLTRRYLASHGPATVQDLRWWSSITASDIKEALGNLEAAVRSENVNDLTLWSATSDNASTAEARGTRLLQTYDELIVGYTQSRYLGDPRREEARAAWKDRSLPNGLVLRDGRILGHWRRTVTGRSVRVEVLTYEEVGRRGRSALDDAVARLGRFLGRAPTLEVGRI